MTYIKKLTAITAIAAIMLTNFISFATDAPINGATSIATGNTIGAIITISKTGIFIPANEIDSAIITNLDGSAVATTTFTFTAGTDDDTILTIADLALANDTSYIIAFSTIDGDYGTTTVRVGTPTNDIVTVTASVQPILKFGMENNSAALWVLTTAFGGWLNTWIEVGTNAVSWLTITAVSSNGGLSSATATHTINSTLDDALYDAEGYEFTSTPGTDDSAWATITWLVATNVDNLNTTHVIYSADKPQNYDGSWDTTFNVDARIAESTPTASDYTDVIIFTATANF